MTSSVLDRAIKNFRRGNELPIADAEPVFDALINETDETSIAEVLIAWHEKGIAENEIYEIARVMRSRMTRVTSRYETFVDIVGTGGSRAKTFNVSTAASFVTAGAGLPVAKHGNKAATSNSGSSDVLTEMGIDPAVDPVVAERCLNEIGLCFMFAPNYHKLSPVLSKVRRGLGFPTIFNCVGPLCNPASVPHQLIGVWQKDLVPKMAGALARLGTRRSWIVYGNCGLDEIALDGKTLVTEIVGKEIRSFEISPDYFEIDHSSIDGLKSRNASHSASMVENALLGKPHTRAAEDIIVMNAAAALFISGHAPTEREAASLARESLRSGRAQKKLEELARAVPV